MNLLSWVVVVFLLILVLFVAFTIFWMFRYSTRTTKAREAMLGMNRSIDELRDKAQKKFKAMEQ